MRTVGLEIETQIVQDPRGTPASPETTTLLFHNLCKRYGYSPSVDQTTGSTVGIKGAPYGYIDCDNSVANIEVSFGAVETIHNMAGQLRQAQEELKECSPNVTFLSLSRQPTMSDDPDTYAKYCCRKGIYPVVRHRGWDHRVGLTTSSTQPCVGVSLEEAIPAVACLQALSGVFIGFFANSPLFMWRETGTMESRANTWNQFMATSRFPKDQALVAIPHKRIFGWGEYLATIWNHVPPFLPSEQGGMDYKKSLCLIPQDDMTMYDFLMSPDSVLFHTFNGNDFDGTQSVVPSGFYVDKGFWWAFWSARIRSEFDHSINPRSAASLTRCKNDDVIARLKPYVRNLYIEVRDIGTTAHPLAALALVLGVVENLSQALSLMESREWNEWRQLRDRAVQEGLPAVIADAIHILDIARTGLTKRGLGEEQYLEPLYARLAAGTSPAHEVLRQFEKGGIPEVIRCNQF